MGEAGITMAGPFARKAFADAARVASDYGGAESWLGLFEQFSRFDKWSTCRVYAATGRDSMLK